MVVNKSSSWLADISNSLKKLLIWLKILILLIMSYYLGHNSSYETVRKIISITQQFTTLSPEKKTWHFAGISKCIFLKLISCIQVSLKFVPRGPVYDKSVLALIMTWYWTSNKPLLETRSTNVCIVVWHHWATKSQMNARILPSRQEMNIFESSGIIEQFMPSCHILFISYEM